mgnify:FL=1
MKNKDVLFVFAGTAAVLMIPALAMLMNTAVDWNATDFLIMGGLLLITGFTLAFVIRRFKTLKSRILFGGIVLLAFLLIWAELAVGIFNSPIAGS